MAEKFVAKASEMKDGDRRIVFVGDHEIGVFRHEGEYLRLQQFLPAPGRPGLRRPDHRQGRGAAAAGQDLAGPVLLRHRDALRLPLARHGIRHEDRRMRLRPQDEAEEIQGRCKKGTRSMSSPKAAAEVGAAVRARPRKPKAVRQAGPWRRSRDAADRAFGRRDQARGRDRARRSRKATTRSPKTRCRR